MKVLSITGDRRFGPGNERYELQKSAVGELTVIYWGRGSFAPRFSKRQFDVVTVQDPFWRGLFAQRAARRLGARFNVQVHADLSGQSFAKRTVARFVLRRADSIRVVSEKIKQQVEHIGAHAPIHVLPIFVDLSRFQSVIRKAHEGKNILWVGRFEEEKNPFGAIEVFKEVLKSVPDIKLTMLGKGSLEHALKQHTEVPVEFPGWKDPIPYLQETDVVVCTSWHESFGASIIEALAAGVPVVTPDVGVAREAGAIVVSRTELASSVVRVVEEGIQGHLALHMPTAEEWAKQWQQTL